MLSNLRYLDLGDSRIKELSPGILPKLSQLQVLLLGTSFTVAGEEVASLSKLEELECCFHDVGELNTLKTLTRSSNLMQCNLLVAQSFPESKLPYDFDQVCFCNCCINEGDNALSLPECIKNLRFYDCNIESSGLCLEKATKLK